MTMSTAARSPHHARPSSPRAQSVFPGCTAADVAKLTEQLRAYARRRVATDDVARELVQETWVAALGSLPNFAGRSSIRTWLTSILRRKIADLYRSRKPTVEFEDSRRGVEGSLQRIMAREITGQVLNAIGELSPREREAVELCGVAELDREEAASRMGLSRPCLRVTLCRGRKHLRERFAESA